MAVKQPYEAYTFTYDFSADVGEQTIATADVTFAGADEALVQSGQTISGSKVLVKWSEGTSGVTYVTTVRIETSGGDKYELDGEIIVVEFEAEPAPLTGYQAPTAAHFRARFPGKFDAVSSGQIVAALSRASRQVDESWTEGDFAEGRMLYAAAFLRAQGLGVAAAGEAEALAGIKSVKSGALSVEFAGASGAGDQDPAFATVYGRQFLALRRANRGGPLVTSTGTVPGGQCAYGAWRIPGW